MALSQLTCAHVAVVVFAALSLGACKDEESSGPVSSGDFVDAYVQRACDFQSRCTVSAKADLATCLEVSLARAEESELGLLMDEVAAGQLGFDEGAAARCLDALEAHSCLDGVSPLDAPCSAVFVGKLEDGATCLHDEECNERSSCFENPVCPGTCTPLSAAGGDCDAADCERGLDCVAGRCQAGLAEGSSCSFSTASCGDGLGCLLADGSALKDQADVGTCQAQATRFSAKVGEACVGAGALGTWCGPGLACVVGADQGDGRCAPRAQRGEPCENAYPNGCATDSYCTSEDPDHLGAGVCKALPKAGEACTTVPDFECAFGLVCFDDAICRAPGRVAAACTDPEQCLSGDCAAGKCAAKDFCQ